MAETLAQFMVRAEAMATERGIELTQSDRASLASRFEESQAASIQAAPDTPQPNVRANFPPMGRIERNVQPGMAAVGGMLGGLAGGGPTLGAGAIPGAMAGAAAGGLAGRGAEEALRALRTGASGADLARQAVSAPLPASPEDTRGPVRRTLESAVDYGNLAAREASFELLGAGVPALVPSLARNALWRMSGVSGDEAYRMIRAADEAAIPVSIKDVSKHSVVRGYPRILGSFPFINTPMQRAYVDQGLAVGKASDSLMHRIGPSVGMARMGRTMARSGGRAFKVFKGRANERYATALDAAKQANARVPSQNTREVAEGLVADFLEKRPRVVRTVTDADGVSRKVRVPLRSSTTARAKNFAQRIADLEDTMSVEQFRNLSDDLAAEIKMGKRHGFQVKQLMRLKEAMEVDFSHIQAPPEVIALLNEADEFYKAGMSMFESSTAKKFGQVNRNIFKVGYEEAGPKAIDELKAAVFKENSPEAIRELRNIVLSQGAQGRPVWKATVASHLDNIFHTARKVDEQSGIELIDYAKVRRSLGIDNKRSGEYSALVEMLKGTGVSVGQVERFLNVSEAVFKEGIPNVNQFVRRRAVLGGRKALARSFTGGVSFGAGAGTGSGMFKGPIKTATGALAFIFGARQIGKIVTDPKSLRAALEASKPGLSRIQRIAVLRRLGAFTPGIFAVRNAAGQTFELTAEQVNEGIEDWTQQANEAQRKARVRMSQKTATGGQ